MYPDIPKLTNADLTTGEPTGQGLFDVLAKSAGEHALTEFTAGRLRGTEYAQVYVGMLNGAMQNAVQYLVQGNANSSQAALIAAQSELTKIQALIAQTELEQAAVKLDILRNELIKSQREADLINAQIAMTHQQKITEEAQTKNIKEGVVGKTQTKIVNETTAIRQQADLTHAQFELTNVKSDNEKLFPVMQTAQIGRLASENTESASRVGLNSAQVGKITKEKEVMSGSIPKMVAESSLLSWKEQSEKAQTTDNSVPESVIGKQLGVYSAQITGYTRKAEQAAAKTSLDAFAIMANAEDYGDIPAAFQTGQINKVINKLNSGVGVV